MVKVVIDGKEIRLTGRLADVVRKIVEHADRITDGSKILRLALRKDKVSISIEEELG